ncbi:hypothetical protein BRM3_00750 [Brachybacterium huguangmaarense]|uniref:General stress protein 17M-like domain-containing protein n=1 Tax=Brachybacterium huguangmaarense TaxID=1652028 RepID=A0ABY6G1C3_9MICO|nr:general stress protein [Brachybacterium huguangmaarense]UYG17001.1 hypothetical protein BRM3_00750 [Brachybacterium huguangmaarense]
MTSPQNSPLDNQLFRLKFPRSLGAYGTYAEVQAVVDTLADHEFPVENTMIVGTDLKLIERVTGRRTWGRVIGGGVLSGLWMGLFVGILFSLFTAQVLTTVVMSMLMGIVFFTIWSAISYAMSGGRRDFTSMTATIPMQYELLVEHSHADRAREILGAAGTGPAAFAGGGYAGTPAPAPVPDHGGYGQPAAPQGDGRYGQPAAEPVASPAPGGYGSSPAPEAPAGSDGGYGQVAPDPRDRPVYGRPAGEDEPRER